MWFRSCAGTDCCALRSLIAMSCSEDTRFLSIPCTHTVSTSSSQTFQALVVVCGAIHLFFISLSSIRFPYGFLKNTLLLWSNLSLSFLSLNSLKSPHFSFSTSTTPPHSHITAFYCPPQLKSFPPLT